MWRCLSNLGQVSLLLRMSAAWVLLQHKPLMLPDQHAVRQHLAPCMVAGCSADTTMMHAQVVLSRVATATLTMGCMISMLGAPQRRGAELLHGAARNILRKTRSLSKSKSNLCLA